MPPTYDAFSGYDSAPSKQPKRKKRKVVAAPETGLLGAGWERYDATGLATHYTSMKEVPAHLKKYFGQRTRFFSLYHEGCLLDEEGWYSVTPERIANQIAERCRCETIVDAFCGVGGNAIAFAQTCERVIAIDNSPVRLALARHNAVIYGVQDRIEFILADFPSWVRSVQSIQSRTPSSSLSPIATTSPSKIDVIFLSPPWGGPAYISGSGYSPTKPSTSAFASEPTDVDPDAHPVFSLDQITPLPGAELFDLARTLTPHIAYFLPRNTDVNEIAALISPSGENAAMREGEKVEIEEEWMGTKLKALTCYFGGLAKGQEHLWTAGHGSSAGEGEP